MRNCRAQLSARAVLAHFDSSRLRVWTALFFPRYPPELLVTFKGRTGWVESWAFLALRDSLAEIWERAHPAGRIGDNPFRVLDVPAEPVSDDEETGSDEMSVDEGELGHLF